MIWRFKRKQKEARVHFIPDLNRLSDNYFPVIIEILLF
jgi:hypothetical protein